MALQCKHAEHEVILVITLACICITVTMSATRQDKCVCVYVCGGWGKCVFVCVFLNLLLILSGNSFEVHPIILKNSPTKIALLTKIHANLLMNAKKIIYLQLQITTLNRHEILSTTKDFLSIIVAIEIKNIDCGLKFKPVKVLLLLLQACGLHNQVMI